jgi:hypothetical protein
LSCWDLPNQVFFCWSLGTIGKPSMIRGTPSWFHNVSTCSWEVIEYWTFFSLKIHLN